MKIAKFLAALSATCAAGLFIALAGGVKWGTFEAGMSAGFFISIGCVAGFLAIFTCEGE